MGTRGGGPMALQFRLQDGTLIGPNKYHPIDTVANVKETLLSQWPPTQESNRPETIDDITLICGGKELCNYLSLAEAIEPPPRQIADGYITIVHFVRHAPRPPPPPEGEAPPENNPSCTCTCTIS
jgi:hypothetical protein